MPKNKIVEMILSGLIGPVEMLIHDKIVEVLKKLHAHDSETYTAALQGLYIGSGQLNRVTTETKTKLDDAVVEALVAACEDSADEFGVELPGRE